MAYLPAGTPVLSRDGAEQGEATGTTRRCRTEGCLGIRVGVRWPGRKGVTWPCSKGLLTEATSGRLQIV